jgi:transposase InsO family protein
MYRVHGKLLQVVAQAHPAQNVELWHERFGHAGQDAIRRLQNGTAVTGMHSVKDKKECDVCIQAKQTRESFSRSTSRAAYPLELVHSDLVGPMRVQGLRGERYFVTLLDDFSRYCEVFCLKKKSEAASTIIDAMLRWERQVDRKVKVIRTDHGKEYQGLLKQFATKNGIVRQYSAPYVPEQNGRAERLNRTLVERGRALLLEHGVSTILWPEAVQTASYLRNIELSVDQEKTPSELMFGRKPDVEHLRVFGCKGRVYIRKVGRDKFDSVGEECMMIGYATNSKAWKVMVVRDDKLKILESPNVRFFEKRASRVSTHLPRTSLPFEVEEEHDDVSYNEVDITTDDVEGLGNSDTESTDLSGGQGSGDENAVTDGDDEEEGDGGSTEEEICLSNNPIFEGEVNEETEDEEQPARRYPVRQRYKPWAPYTAYLNSTSPLTDNPATYRQAMERPDAEMWAQATTDEMKSLREMGVYEKVDLPSGKTALPSKLVLTVKRDEQGNVVKYKARLVAKGFKQLAGRDFDEVFAPTAQNATFRILLAHAASIGHQIRQLDVKTAFLYGDLNEELYLRLPSELGGEVWRLRKAIYGLKQAAREWHAKLRATMQAEGFEASQHDPCLFMKGKGVDRVLVLIHVDDCFCVGTQEMTEGVKQTLAKHFEIKDMGEAKFFLGQEIRRDERGIFVSQTQYAKNVLQRFEMWNCKPIATPMSLGIKLDKGSGDVLKDGDKRKDQYGEIVGSLLYLSVHTRPDLAHALGVLSRFMQQPTDMHFMAAKRVLRYLKGTCHFGLMFQCHVDAKAKGVLTYVDADLGGDLDRRRSTSGVVITMNGCAVMWGSKLQSIVATSTAEAEYIAGAMAVKDALWVRKILGDLYGAVVCMKMCCDNQSAIHLMTQHTAGVSGRTKHVDLQYHFVRDRYQRGDIDVTYVSTGEQLADMFTKPLPGPVFEKAIQRVMGGKQLQPNQA